jgi:hypothetical protein
MSMTGWGALACARHAAHVLAVVKRKFRRVVAGIMQELPG